MGACRLLPSIVKIYINNYANGNQSTLRNQRGEALWKEDIFVSYRKSETKLSVDQQHGQILPGLYNPLHTFFANVPVSYKQSVSDCIVGKKNGFFILRPNLADSKWIDYPAVKKVAHLWGILPLMEAFHPSGTPFVPCHASGRPPKVLARAGVLTDWRKGKTGDQLGRGMARPRWS